MLIPQRKRFNIFQNELKTLEVVQYCACGRDKHTIHNHISLLEYIYSFDTLAQREHLSTQILI